MRINSTRQILFLPAILAVMLHFYGFAQVGKHGAINLNGTAIVNEFTRVTVDAVAGQMQVVVENALLNDNGRFSADLQAGDLVMVIQHQGASLVSETDDPLVWGSVQSYNNAGNFELKEVLSVPDNQTVRFTCPLEKNYTSGAGTQLVRVPRYSTLTVGTGGLVTTEPWNGTTGGVLAIESQGDIVIQSGGAMDVSGLGFRGGLADNGTAYNYTGMASVDSTSGAHKGEGIGGFSVEYDLLGGRYGRGAPANGGGGGNNHNAGGGGGANGGVVGQWNGLGNPDNSSADLTAAWNIESPGFATNQSSGGGKGGHSFSVGNEDPTLVEPGNALWQGDNRRNVGGLGGRPLTYDGDRMFFGGGGGAGDGNNNVSNKGGEGGGIMYLLTKGSITGAGTLRADGGQGQSTQGNGNDAPGGGGGGGAIWLDVTGNINLAEISAKGGAGGNQEINMTIHGTEAEGPGGGGGGGAIVSSQTINGNTVLTGGQGGQTNQSVLTRAPYNGATAGGQGSKYAATVWDFTVTGDEQCSGEDAMLLAAHGTGAPVGAYFQWYDTQVGGSVLHTGNEFPITNLTLTQGYWVESCPLSERKYVEAEVLPLPVLLVTGPDSICQGDSADLVATGAPTYQWSGMANINDPSSSTPKVWPGQSGSISVVGTSAQGCQSSIVYEIVVVSLTVPVLSPSGPFCVDTVPIVLEANPSDGIWSGSGIVNLEVGIFDPETAGPGIHKVGYVPDAFCPVEGEIEIEVLPVQQPAILPAGPFCANDSEHQMKLQTISSGVWTGEGIDAGGIFTPSSVGPGSFEITFQTDGRCVRTDQVVIDVYPIPDPTIDVISPVCADTAQYNVSVDVGGGIWSGDILNGGNVIIPSEEVVGNHWVYYTVDNSFGCTVVDSAQVTIIAVKSPEILPMDPVCVSEDNLQLEAVDGSGMWQGNGIIDSGAGIFAPSVADTGSHMIVYTVNTDGFCVRTDTLIVVVDPEYFPKIQPVKDLCHDEGEVTLMVQTDKEGWWMGNGVIEMTQAVFDPRTVDPGSHVVKYTIDGACNSRDSIRIQVNRVPDPVISGDRLFCVEDDPYSFSVNEPGGYWNGEGLSDSLSGVFTPSLADVGFFEITYMVNVKNCVGYDTIEVEVDMVTVETNPWDTLCSKNPLDEVVLVADAPGAIAYEWSNGETSPSVTLNEDGEFWIDVTNESGCKARAWSTIVDDCNCNLYMPNAFTPDADGLNDVFHVEGRAPINFDMRIYDRWGELVFHTNDFNQGWDGEVRNELGKSDVYNVNIECDIGGNQRGRVSIIR